MKKIYSLEPLPCDLLKIIKENTGYDCIIVDRNDIKSIYSIRSFISNIICRDRDDVSYLLKNCNNLRFIFVVSTGVEKLPFNELKKRNIVVCNTGGVNSGIMSEYVMAYILSHSVRIYENYMNQLKHYWKKNQCVDTLAHTNLLIVGAGRTGRMLAKKAKSFEMNIVGIKKHPCDLAYFDKIINLNEMDSYLPWADFVVCLLPLTTETLGLFNESKFTKMKATSTFINISRGKIVVEQDLLKALENHYIKSAVIDVFESEPISPNSELWNLPNVVLTPHSAGRLENFMYYAIMSFVHNYNAYLSGTTIPNKVNIYDGY